MFAVIVSHLHACGQVPYLQCSHGRRGGVRQARPLPFGRDKRDRSRAGNLSAAAIWIPPFRFGDFSIPKNKACGRKLSRSESLRRRPPGLSQPDAPCERTDIRARTENLTTPNRKNRKLFPLDVAPPPPPTISVGSAFHRRPPATDGDGTPSLPDFANATAILRRRSGRRWNAVSTRFCNCLTRYRERPSRQAPARQSHATSW